MSLKRIVLKFGGSSLKSSEAILQVIHIISSYNVDLFVIVSAIEGISNKLIDLCYIEDKRDKILFEIKEIHKIIISGLGLLYLLSTLDIELQRIVDYITKNSISPRVVDYVLSFGERLSSLILCAALNKADIETHLMDACKIIITDDLFGKANPNLELIKHNIFNEMDSVYAKKVIVTQGFIGRSESGYNTTLGRGGSDYSAALIAEAINSKELVIYSDVDGVYSIDPRYESNAKPILKIDFKDMFNLARYGTKILHPSTIIPCRRAGIIIRIKSTYMPDACGTVVSDFVISPINAVSLRRNQVILNIHISCDNSINILMNILRKLQQNSEFIDILFIRGSYISIIIDLSMVNNVFAENLILENIKSHLLNFVNIELIRHVSLITVFGFGKDDIYKVINEFKSNDIMYITYFRKFNCIWIALNYNNDIDILRYLHNELMNDRETIDSMCYSF